MSQSGRNPDAGDVAPGEAKVTATLGKKRGELKVRLKES